MAELCQKALEADIEVDYVLHVIRKRNLMPHPAPADCEKWPWALRIYTLGRFKIIRGGNPDEVLQFSGKVQKRPLDILKVLIAGGGGEVPEEHIVDCLWPDAYGDAAHSAFTTTLSRLRRLLGVEGAIRFQGGGVSLDPEHLWVDALAFERILAQLDKKIATSENDLESVLRLAAKAAGLYVQCFLPADEGQFWTISFRERLRSKFSRLINLIGGLLEKAGQWEKAMQYYHKGLDIDDLSEDFCQRLMACCHQLGRYPNAIEIYKRYRKLLSVKMGIEPSARTKAIYEESMALNSLK
jgi:LuxR family transcriptional regulator, maltose regulon positive regulatory protein